jgi:hypothetical protein
MLGARVSGGSSHQETRTRDTLTKVFPQRYCCKYFKTDVALIQLFVVDDGHRQRMKLLEKHMVETIEILDALQSRAFDLRVAGDPAYEWIKHFQAGGAFSSNEDTNTLSIKNIMEVAQSST